MYNIFKRRLISFISVFLALAFCLVLAVPSYAAYDLPITPANQTDDGVSDESIYLVHLNSGDVILSHNADTTRYIASTTKMMTALLLMESGYDLNTQITIPTELTQEFNDIQAENGADMELKIGEQLTMEELLYGMMLRSANDASSVIAYVLSNGDMDAFFDRMNERAVELGCTDTNFTCAHGLYDAGNVSTAKDLALIGQEVMRNSYLMQVINTESFTVRANNAHQKERVIETTNFMRDTEYEYYREYISGIKTGFTTLAGRCFVTSAQSYDGQEYLLVILNSTKEDLFKETAEIFDWVFASFGTRILMNSGQELGEVVLKNSYDAESFVVTAPENVTAYGHPDDVIDIKVDLLEDIKAPVQKGDVVGEVKVSLAGKEVAVLPLTAPESFESKVTVDLRNLLAMLPFLVAGVFVLMIISRIVAKKYR